MHRVIGRPQHYAWGDPSTIPAIVGEPADGRPWAEWWMGTHPLLPATVEGGASLQSVAGDLPYLLKLMAAAMPLSLQTHPTSGQGRAGFEREEHRGIPRDSPDRVYRDPFAKPELLCAVTSFDTLCGFRPVENTIALLREIGAIDLAALLQSEQLATTVAALYQGRIATASTVAACREHHGREAALVTELDEMYPGDPSVVVTLLLNRVMLHRGEAVFLGPGNLHAYLRGFGVEIMANSDNVVRGGLTHKHVDIDELLEVLDFTPLTDPVVRPVERDSGCWVYETANTPFRLIRFDVGADEVRRHQATGRELILWVDGDERGTCVYLASGEDVELRGPATVFLVEETDPTTGG